MPDPTLPMPTEPVPYFDPTRVNQPVAPVDDTPTAPAWDPMTAPAQPYQAPQPAYQAPQPAYQAPQPALPAVAAPGPAPIIAQVGEVRVSSTTIYTPNGEIPLRGSQWIVTDQWVATQKTPSWAIVLAIVLFFCLTVFSLLFLLAKETAYTGTVQVLITNGGHQYVTRIPVTTQAQVATLHQQVNYVRSLSAL
jgi:hypothetical protein